MTTAELQALIRSLQEYRTDLVHVEAKRAESDLPKRLWETLSARAVVRGLFREDLWEYPETGAFDLTDTQRMALAMLRRGEEVTNAAYRQISGLDSRVATRELGDLVQRGLVTQDGTGRWTTYRLAPAAPGTEKPRSKRRRADRRGEIISLLRQERELGRAEVADRLGVSNETAGRWLARLRAERVVELTTRSPRDPNAAYRLTHRTD